MTENPNTTRALFTRLSELQNVDVFDKTHVTDIHSGHTQVGKDQQEHGGELNLSSYPHVELSSSRTLVARLLVGADGLNSPVRKFAGIGTRGWDYDRHGVVATLKLASGEGRRDFQGTEATAYQRFLPTGPIAMLPLPDGHSSLVWTTTPARAAHLKTLSPVDFMAMVDAAFRLSVVDIDYISTIPSGQNEEFQWRLKVDDQVPQMESNGSIPHRVQVVQDGSIASFPLRFRHSSSYVRPRIALIGDAAHTIHPLAGQGLNMGLADSRSLSTTLRTAVEHGADIGDELQCLDLYNSQMWMANSRMLGAVDKLHWLYSAKSAPIVALRALGLDLVERTGSIGLKDWFMRQAGVV